MILAIPAWRRGFFKITGSVIAEAQRRGHTVRLLWRTERKPGEAVSPEEIGKVFPAVTITTLLEPADAVIGPALHLFGDGLPPGRRYSLDDVWEQVIAPNWGAFDMKLWVTDYQQELWCPTLPALPDRSVGSTMLDAYARVDPDAVRTRYGLDRPVLLFMALKFRVAHWQRRWLYRPFGYRRLLRVLRAWCDDAGWLLVAKTREKNADPAWLRQYADRIVGDEDLWPHTSMQLMRAASACVHFQSNACLEAAACGVPQVSIRVPHPHLAAYPVKQTLRDAVPGMYAWPGVVASTDWRLPVVDLVPIDATALADYRQRFTNTIGGAAARVLDLVEGQCA